MPFATSSDTRIHYQDQGEGAPILLVPGLGGSTRQLERISAALAKTNRVISVDPRGGGQSDKPDSVYSADVLALDMVSVLDDAGIDQAHFVGISFGGMIGQELAIRHPDRVKSLSLFSSYAASDVWTDQMWAVRDMLIRQLGLDAHFQMAIMFLFSPEAMHRQAELVEQMHAGFKANPPHLAGYRRQMAYCRHHDATARLGEIRVPTLVVNGDEDILAAPRMGRQLADLIPHARFEQAAAAAHLYMLSEPERFAKTTRDFIAGL